ncbi:MAG: TonB-dependent receptor, partial [Paramuribaculum sp.]|nr:TonB-dependent receptor [Paramuribaculum sp.]
VMVTAIKQPSRLTLQPVAVTILGTPQTRKWRVTSMKKLSEIAPNFYVPDYGSRITSSIYVRGIGARMDQPVVGMNVDNQPYLNKAGYDFDVADIERIEVLRGPQSILYGRNTMGGQINIYTLSPMRFQGSKLAATLGNGPTARLALSHYAKFSPKLAMAFVGDFYFTDGFYKNRYNAHKVDAEKALNLRWRTIWKPRESVTFDNVATFNLTRQAGYPYEFIDTKTINYNDTCFYRRNTYSDALTAKWNVGEVKMSSITSFQYLDDNMTLDQDFLEFDYFTLTQKRKEWSLSEEVVARGESGNYSWLAGIFGFYRNTSMSAPVTMKSDGVRRFVEDSVQKKLNKVFNANDRIPVNITDFRLSESQLPLYSDFKMPVWNVALYHQSDLQVGRVKLSLGARLDYESMSFDYRSRASAGYSYKLSMNPVMPPVEMNSESPVAIDNQGRLTQHFLEFLPKFTVLYDMPWLDKSNLYLSIGKGFKSGGYNTQMFSEVLQQDLMNKMRADMMGSMQMSGRPGASSQSKADVTESSAVSSVDVDEMVSYAPEYSWNYEVGAHLTPIEDKLTADLALFYIDCRDQQITMFPPGNTTGRITTNAGRTRSFGVEAQVHYTPDAHWSFNASYGYTNAKFKEFIDGNHDYSGNYVPYAPVNTLFLSGTYSHYAGNQWQMSYNLNMRGVGRIYWNEMNDFQQPFYAQLGASVSASKGWLSFEAWMENITGTKFNTFYFQSVKNTFVQKGKPRRFGITIRINFNTES